jgi:large subunit ribosomal protein L21
MYVIVDIAGQQYKVEKDQKIFVNRLEGDSGSKIDFDQVLLVDDDGKVQVGMPVVKNVVVTASIVSHLKGDTVKVFKKKRRKGYQKLNGHRQALTQLLIESIGEVKAKAKAAPKKESEPKAVVEIKELKAEKIAVEEPKAAAKPKAKKEAENSKTKPVTKAAKETKEKKAAGAKAKKPAKKAPSTKAAPKTKKETKKETKKGSKK